METALTKVEFEKRFLNLVYQTDTLITAANVAYHLDIPIEEAQEHLLSLELSGVIQQETDDQGRSYYMMPNRPEPGTLPARVTDRAQPGGEGGPPPGAYNPGNAPAAPIYRNPGAPARNVNGMVLNVIFPGVGSLVAGQKIGLAMLGLVLLGLVTFIVANDWGKLLGLLPIAAGWIWSIIAGVGLLSEPERRPPR